MSSLLNYFRKAPDPKDLVRKWQADLRSEQRGLERQIRDLQREEKLAQKNVRDAAKRGDVAGAKTLAREIVRTRRVAGQLYMNKAHLIDMNARLTEQLGVVKVAGTLKKSTEVMALVNRLVTVPQLAATVRAMGREMMKAGVIDEVMGDAIDSVMDGPEAEGEVDAEVDKVLAEVAGADVEALAGARAPATRVAGAGRAEEAAGEEGEELDELKARLEAVRAG